jgi:methionine-rich copper-binding protein CopC
MTKLRLAALQWVVPIALLVLLSLPGQIFAHAQLVSSIPAASEMAMPAPTELRLKFSEGLELKFTIVKVTGPDNAIVKTGPLMLDPRDESLLIVPLASPLPDGQYTIEWHVLAKDGHKTKGAYSFTSMQ